MKKRALITGITGMDGSHLAEFLLKRGYEVHGIARPVSTFNRQRIDHIFPEGKRSSFIHYADITDPFSIMWVLKKVKPHEIYHLSAQSHVGISWEMPYSTLQTTGAGLLNILESCRVLGLKAKIYQASTSELFSGKPGEAPQDENTPKDPVSPYGTAKQYAFQIAKNYREGHKMFVCNGILFNHESERRGDNFVTKKILNAVPSGKVKLGDLDASRDWGYAPEYVEGMWKILQQKTPDDYVLATGETHTIREFLKWTEELTGKKLKVIHDKRMLRPTEVRCLLGNPSKAKKKLGWEAKTKGKELVKKMLQL